MKKLLQEQTKLESEKIDLLKSTEEIAQMKEKL